MNYNYFLDCPNLLIEVKINYTVFDNRDVKLVSFIDCSSTQRLEKFKADCKYKTLLISTISHELRSPVNAILGTLELVEHLLPTESINLLEMAKECCNMITSHINDLTDYGKMYEDKLQIIKQNVLISPAIKYCIDMIKYTAEQKGIYVTYNNYDENLEAWADERRLKQIVINLLSNAIKFTLKGGIMVKSKNKNRRDRKSVV